MITKVHQQTAKILIGIPSRPSLNGPYEGCRPPSLRRRKKEIGNKYEMYSEIAEREIIAKNAAVFPMVMRPINMQMATTSPSALIGTRRVGWTCAISATVQPHLGIVGRTALKNEEKGSPLSLANAHTRRDTDAHTLKSDTISGTIMKQVNTVAPAVEPVAWR